jgi:DNA repair photolyase
MTEKYTHELRQFDTGPHNPFGRSPETADFAFKGEQPSIPAANGWRGRGATIAIQGRFDRDAREVIDDGWADTTENADGYEARQIKTLVHDEEAKSIISKNDSPDIPFEYSINPYRGCEHGCVYCYARPSHAYVGLSPGIDFETRLFAKVNAAPRLRAELSARGYQPKVINIGANTDGYQPIEKTYRLTRGLLEVLGEARHPVAIITKNAMVERDIDILGPMAAAGLAHVTLSVTTLDSHLAAKLEPRASAPARRLAAIRRLRDAGIPVAINIAPIIPFLTDAEIERIMAAGADAGATSVGYTVLRLPWEVKDIFRNWLARHFPNKAEHVMSRQREMRGGRDNESRFGARMHAEGVVADVIRERFRKAAKRHGIATYGRDPIMSLRTDLFRPPASDQRQGVLF